jgi:RND family efflux transporter MFP subunit
MSANRISGRWWLVALAAVAAAAGSGWYFTARGKPAAATQPAPKPAPLVSVDVVSPQAGGVARVCTQPGTVEPFAAADLYAKVSGYLVEQAVERGGKKVPVDIGTVVKAGEPLVRLSAPEYERQIAQDEADVDRTAARAEQMAAAVATARADLGAAEAAVALARADHKSKTSYRAYREKQRERVRALADEKAVDRKLAEEQEDHYQAAVAAELAATESVTTAKQKVAAAAARVIQAEADHRYAAAEGRVAKAKLDKSRVLLGYTVITSPYTGVVTKRNFHAGDFVKSADAGGDRVPVLVVQVADPLRVVVQVPDRDVPFVKAGDPAAVEIDAFPGKVFKATVARTAEAEDPLTRAMRTEIDLPNPDGALRRGMYGRVTLTLRGNTPAALRVPSAALVKAEGGKASVRVVRDGRVHLVPVAYAADNGSEAEIVSGLTAADKVVVRASGTVEDGTPVTVNQK